MARRNPEHETCSTLSGPLICSCGACRMMANGPSSARTSAPASMTFTARPSWSSTIATNPRGARRTVKARELWDAIVTSQIETGTPYMLYKDNECQVQPAESGHHPIIQPLH